MTAIRSSRWLWFSMVSSLTIMIMACGTLPTPTLRATDVPDPTGVPGPTNVRDPTGVPGPTNVRDPTGVPGPTNVPGSSDVLATIDISGATNTPKAIDVPKTTSTPGEPSLENQSSEELFRRAIVAMHNLQTFHLSLIVEEQDVEGSGVATVEGAQSGENSRSIIDARVSDGDDDYREIVCIPPHVFSRESDNGDWYRQGIEADDGDCSFLIVSSLVIFPHIGLPLRLYDLTFLGIERIGDVPTTHMRLDADWAGIGDWLVAEGHLAEVASRFSMSVGEVEDIYFEDAPDFPEVWIDEYGLMHELVAKFDVDNVTLTWYFSAFNVPVIIEPPAQFEEGPPVRSEVETPPSTVGSWSTPNLEISVVPATLQVGETAVVTVTVSGQGGLPQYTLYVDPAILKINTPNTLNHSNLSTVPRWTIEAVGVGSTSFSVGMSYETQTCSDGACYFHLTSTGSPSVVVEVVDATTPGAAGKIAFSSDRDGNVEIYTMNADGSNQTRLTSNQAGDHGPAWSPDGARIAFNSNRDGNFEIYTMNGDGSNQTRLTFNDTFNWNPAWSPDGARIAFDSFSRRDASIAIYTMNADGSDETRLTFNESLAFAPVWSPDGARIAFYAFRDGSDEIYSMNSDGSNQTRLTFNDYSDRSPAWSPDGARIAFNSNRDGNYEIYTMNADGSNQTRLNFNYSADGVPSWSTDGARIAFSSDREGNSEIYTVDADGSNLTRLTFNDSSDFDPTWSPLAAGASFHMRLLHWRISLGLAGCRPILGPQAPAHIPAGRASDA